MTPALLAVAEYVDWINHRRLHGELGPVPPAEYEANHRPKISPQQYRHTPVLIGAGST